MEICENTNIRFAVKQQHQNPWILKEEQKGEKCKDCDYWRGVCVININSVRMVFSESDPACQCFKPRQSKVVPLASPGRW